MTSHRIIDSLGSLAILFTDNWMEGESIQLFEFFFLVKILGRYHPDKNADDPVASEKFQEATFSYNILSDPDKRRQYDSSGFEVIDGMI